MTKFIAVPGENGVFQQSFLQQLVSINFPAGKLVRVSFTGSGPNSNLGKPSIAFPFGTFTSPVLNLVLSATGVIPGITDPPNDAMIANLYAWSIINDEGNFVYYNTSKVQSRYGKYSPVVINSPAFQGISAFSTTHILVWFYRYNGGLTPSGPFDPLLLTNFDGGILAVFDPTQTSTYSVEQILDFINGEAEGTLVPGTNGIPAIPVGDGGDASKGADLVAALVAGSKIVPSAGGPNGYVATTITSNANEEDAGWGLQGGLFDIKDGAFVPTELAHVSDFNFGVSVPAITITIDIDADKNTMTESKN